MQACLGGAVDRRGAFGGKAHARRDVDHTGLLLALQVGKQCLCQHHGCHQVDVNLLAQLPSAVAGIVHAHDVLYPCVVNHTGQVGVKRDPLRRMVGQGSDI